MANKKFYFIISGNLIMQVSAKDEEKAERKAEEYLEINSPLRNWEIYSEGEAAGIDVVDIEI